MPKNHLHFYQKVLQTLYIASSLSLHALHHNGIPSTELLNICSLVELPHHGTLTSINQSAQEWVRKPGQERWEMEQKFEDKRSEIMAIFDSMGLVKPLYPTTATCDYLLISGAHQIRMQQRINFVSHLIINGKLLITKGIFLLSGARPTDTKSENIHLGATEAQAMETIYQQSPLKDHPYTLINVPMKINAHGTVLRPTLEDTIGAWVAQNLEGGHILFISSQPFITRHSRIIKELLPQRFSFEATGGKAQENLPIVVYLDEIAHTLSMDLDTLK